ncbi:MAG: acetolactate synthase small subunit [Muribaculaceae bacterium]|nr:acetolactate synthase small subunit [Muribaculaceae bacterium]MDY3933203.1 acetolactate synthase small subunit [Muribaculaceae bacterium]
MMEQTLYTITVFTENRVGLLNQISIIFTRRKINIESLSVSPSSIKGVHKFTITAYTDLDTIQKLTKQIEKRIDVLRAYFYTDDEIVYQEIALFKVPTEKLLAEKNLEAIIRRNNARILEITPTYTVVEKTGHSDETEALFNEFNVYGISQFVRSGRVAVTKSDIEYVSDFIHEQRLRKAHINE